MAIDASETGTTEQPSARVLRARERAAYHKTSHRGLSYQLRGGGKRTYYGYIVGRGRLRLNASTDRAALEEYSELRGKVGRGERIAPASVRFGDVAEAWLEQKKGRLRDWTRRGYRASLDNELLPRFGHRKLRDMGFDDILSFVRSLEERGHSTSTINSHLLPLSGTFRYARKLGYVSQNPVDLLESSDRVERRARETDHVWSDKEIDAVIRASEYLARQPESRYDYSPLIRTAVFTGLRLGELLGLQWSDVDLEKGLLHVRRQWARTGEYAEPKTKAAKRRVPLSADMAKRLRELKLASKFSEPEHPVFASRNGTPLSHRNAQRRGFEPARDRAAIEDVTFHSLRHAFAGRMIHGGVDPVQLAAVMGHEDARITLARYASLYDQEGTDEIVRAAMSEKLAS